MENFSTVRAALVPRLADLATLAVVVAATWWSSAQRPHHGAALDTAQSTPTNVQMVRMTGPHTADKLGGSALSTTVSATASTTANATASNAATLALITNETWPLQTTNLARDGLQAVGYQPRNQR